MKLPDCPLVPKLLELPGHCSLASCGKVLPPRRSKWCSDKCSRLFYRTIFEEHDWNTARERALKRDGYRCVKCGSDGSDNIPMGRRRGLEVNHIEPRRGAGYSFGCWHHQSNLETLCRDCHVLETIKQRGPIEPKVTLPKTSRKVNRPKKRMPKPSGKIHFVNGPMARKTINESFLAAGGCRPGGMWPEHVRGGVDAYRWTSLGLVFETQLRGPAALDAVFPTALRGV